MLKGLKEEYRQDAVYQVLLQKEYEITSQLQHPMVVSVFSLEEVDGLGLCIIMEWIDGITLNEWLAKGKHTGKQHRHVADMLLEALAYVHSRQTQHRDLKPSNVMLTHEGQHLKLIDFGLSDTDNYAILKAPAGTEGYMAPEGPSDIYSLGCILRELRMGWLSRMVVRKCCAPLPYRYTDIATIKRNLQRCHGQSGRSHRRHFPRSALPSGLQPPQAHMTLISRMSTDVISLITNLRIIREIRGLLIKNLRIRELINYPCSLCNPLF